jgi:RNA recognition motif-containing protein
MPPPGLIKGGGFFSPWICHSMFFESKDLKMETKLYVGNLSYDTTEDDLRTLFSQMGTVATVELIKDRDTGSSKGFAFVEMANQSEAEKAISSFNGYSLGNRQIKVSVARPREERPRGGGWYDNSPQKGFGNRNRRGPSRR